MVIGTILHYYFSFNILQNDIMEIIQKNEISEWADTEYEFVLGLNPVPIEAVINVDHGQLECVT